MHPAKAGLVYQVHPPLPFPFVSLAAFFHKASEDMTGKPAIFCVAVFNTNASIVSSFSIQLFVAVSVCFVKPWRLCTRRHCTYFYLVSAGKVVFAPSLLSSSLAPQLRRLYFSLFLSLRPKPAPYFTFHISDITCSRL